MRLGQWVRLGLFSFGMVLGSLVLSNRSEAAPYAAVVMDARTGEVIHARNADARLHPASLTKMMTLYVVFEAIRNGEISLDTVVRISSKAAAEPPSKLGLKPGQRIKLRYLVRAAAVKSANDAATALAEAVSGSEAAFARRMNRTAKALGMTRSTFKNAHGLTEAGHLSTARDMTTLGRHLFYDYPEYYNLFSRRSTDAGLRDVSNTNKRFLNAYSGADGIKTGYTRAAGFNLVASAERGQERVIATMFGGRSTSQRNAKVAELLDLGFRKAPTRVAVRKPALPRYEGSGSRPAGKTLRVVRAVTTSPLPTPRPGTEPTALPSPELLVAMAETIEQAVTAAQVAPLTPAQPKPVIRPETVRTATLAPANSPAPQPAVKASPAPILDTTAPPPRPEPAADSAIAAARIDPVPARVVVTRVSASGGRLWGINIGRYGSRYQAERVLLKTALAEIDTLDDALRKVANGSRGYEANFVGMTQGDADRACRRLAARNIECTTLGPT